LRAGIIETQGSLSKEVIRRVIQRRLNEVRFCYEENLRNLPELAGRVEVKFVISPAGAVQAASIAKSTLLGDDARTAQCINQAVKRWSFPAPEGGGVVIVQYPFLLETSQ
jgi:TonB family protein